MRIIRYALFGAIFALLTITSASAYSPPPAGDIFFIIRPQVQIVLPPRLIMTPKQLTFPEAQVVYTFSNGQFGLTQGNGLYPRLKVDTSTLNAGDGTAYEITITGFHPNELPTIKDFRLTFNEPVSNDSIDKVQTFLQTNSIDTARITGPGCTANGDSHICLDTITRVRSSGQILPAAHLFQTIPIKGILINGNAGAPGGALQNFSLSGHAIAVGQSITNVVGGQAIAGYPTSSGSLISWPSVSTALNNIYARRSSQPAVSLGTGYIGRTWNLNSASNDPANIQTNTYSTPPEGRLWNIVVAGSTFDIGGPTDISFTGSGTLAISGDKGQNVTVTVHNHLTCSASTRLGLITTGDIRFATSSDHQSRIDCGAYTSLNGNIIFDSTGTANQGALTGIFVAKNSVVLPDPNHLTSLYQISRDSYFATHPTVLFQDLLQVVFSPNS